jgi:hypothetical protein
MTAENARVSDRIPHPVPTVPMSPAAAAAGVPNADGI